MSKNNISYNANDAFAKWFAQNAVNAAKKLEDEERTIIRTHNCCNRWKKDVY